MNIMSEIGRLLSPNDPELVEKTLARIAEQDTWNDVFSTKLIDLLDNIDLLKSEHREKLRTLQAAQEEVSLSLEYAETAHHKASESTREAKQMLDGAVAKLDLAYYFSQAAKQDLQTAKEDMQTAERRLDAADQCLQKARKLTQESQENYVRASKRFQAAVQYALWAVAISMTAIIWVIWVALRPDIPVWAASCASLTVVMAGIFIPRRVTI